MRLTGIEALVVALPPRRPHPMAFGGADLGRYVIVRVSTDEGITGLGEATVLPQWGGDYGRYYGETPETTVAILHRVLAPVLTGCDPLQIERAHERMDEALKGYPYAKCAIDLALHDIAGKALGVPVHVLLGGAVREAIPLAHSLGILDLATIRDEALAAVDDGIRTIKVKIGLDPERDVIAVRELRRALGDEIDLVVDANAGYATPKLAIRTLRRMEEHGIRYAEQPVEGMARMAQVARALDIPVMADESAWTARDVLELAALEAADLISIYTSKAGGLLPARKVAAVAEACGFPCNVNGSAETAIGTAANLQLAATARCVTESCVVPVTNLAGRSQTRIAGISYLDDLVLEPLVYRDGCLLVPQGPGLGVELDAAKLERYAIG